MHALINPLYRPILEIYLQWESFPDFLNPFLEAPALQRLANISQSCWTEYNQFVKYNISVSRLDHSLGVALIIWHFTHDIQQTLAGLFHDVSHTVFSHVGDFLLGDAENQESSEMYTTSILQNDPIIQQELQKLWIQLEQVDDYTQYTIADNPGPQLAADRLEYSLWTPYALGTRTLEEVSSLYNDLIVYTNEKGEEEIWFSTPEKAIYFALLSVENDESIYASYESVVWMSFLAYMLDTLLKGGFITQKQLYTLQEKDIIALLQTASEKTKAMREFYTHLKTYKIDRYKTERNLFTASSKAKKRRIDPLVQTDRWLQRVSSISTDFVAKREYHVNRKEEWIVLQFPIA